jgi:hypothetical protein
MKRILLVLASILLFTGCVSTDFSYVPQAEHISEPRIGSVNTKYVGEELIKQGMFMQHDAIYVPQTVKVGGIGKYTVHQGYYTKKGETNSSEFYLPSGGANTGSVVKCALCDPFKVLRVPKGENNKMCGVTVFDLEGCSKARFERTKVNSAASNSFQQTLIYSGKVGNKLNIGYREFSSNMARPAFNNDVEYDMDVSPIIGYRGAELEVLKATNRSITYRVISNFNSATR